MVGITVNLVGLTLDVDRFFCTLENLPKVTHSNIFFHVMAELCPIMQMSLNHLINNRFAAEFPRDLALRGPIKDTPSGTGEGFEFTVSI